MSRLAPLQIGPLRIDAPVVLAPMTGVTDLPFRKLVKRYGCGLTVTERTPCSPANDHVVSVCRRSNPILS